jgi:hypothetical protein
VIGAGLALGAVTAPARSREFGRLVAILETSPVRPSLTFRFVAETRDLACVKQRRLDPMKGESGC